MTDWDTWRAAYPHMTFVDQQAFYAQAAVDHPDQRQFNRAAVRGFLTLTSPTRVVEVGGWRGDLCAAILPSVGVEIDWTNYEIAPNLTPVCDSPQYHHVVLDRFPWEIVLDGDALVLSHVVEHMLLAEFDRLVDRFTGYAVYVDCPVSDTGENWAGYDGSHILEAGWDAITEVLEGHGFRIGYRWADTIRWFKKERNLNG